jgi:Fic family protein
VTTAIPTKQQQASPDLSMIEQDARRRIEELTEARQRLSLDAITDEDAKRELANVESEIAGAERLLEQTQLAADERQRRLREAEQAAAEKVRASVEHRAARLQPEVVKSERSVDLAFAAAAQAVASFLQTQGELDGALRETGGRGQTGHDLTPSRLEGSLKHHFAAAGVPPRLLDLGPTRTSGPLAPEAK